MWVIAAERPLVRGSNSMIGTSSASAIPLQDDHRRIALPAFDLRKIALGRTQFLRKLAPGHAALGAGEPHQAADGGNERRLIETLRLDGRRAVT